MIPNLLKERGYLTRKTNPRNFTRVSEKQHQAIERYKHESRLYQARKQDLLLLRVEQKAATKAMEDLLEQLIVLGVQLIQEARDREKYEE